MRLHTAALSVALTATSAAALAQPSVPPAPPPTRPARPDWNARYEIAPAGPRHPAVSIALGTDRAIVTLRAPGADVVFVADALRAGRSITLLERARFGAAPTAMTAPSNRTPGGRTALLELTLDATGRATARAVALAPTLGRDTLRASAVTAPTVPAGFSPSGAHDLLAVAAALGDCGPVDVLEGGNTVHCASGLGLQHGSVPTARLEARTGVAAPSAVCADYVDREGFTARELSGATAVCETGVGAVTAARSLADVQRNYRGACRRIDNRGATLLDCRGVRWVFGGPTQVLSRVERLTDGAH